jgi:large conductance mechanosensitive channel
VAFVIGAAFAALVTGLVKDLITPLGGKPDFGNLAFTVNESTFRYGGFINLLLSGLLSGAADRSGC